MWLCAWRPGGGLGGGDLTPKPPALSVHHFTENIFFKKSEKKKHSTNKLFSHLEHLGEEPCSDLLAAEVVQAGQAGHGAAQGPVRGRSDPVGSVDAVHGRLCVSLLLQLDPLRLHLHLGRPGTRRRRWRWRRRRRRRRTVRVVQNPARLLFTFPMSVRPAAARPGAQGGRAAGGGGSPERDGWATLGGRRSQMSQPAGPGSSAADSCLTNYAAAALHPAPSGWVKSLMASGRGGCAVF